MASLLSKAIDAVRGGVSVKASKGTLSEYVIGAPHEYGQPNSKSGDAYEQVTPQRMREIIIKTPTAGAAMNAILDFVVGVNIGVRNIDPKTKVPAAVQAQVDDLLRRPNRRQGKRKFFRSLARDMVTFGYAAVEIEKNASGGVANLHVLDGARFKIDYDEHGTVLGYDMLSARGVPIVGKDGVHAWLPEEVILFTLDEESSTLYGTSRVTQLYACAVLEAMMLNFIGGRFTDSNIPFGVMDVGDVTADELQYAVDRWNDEIAKAGEHRIMLTGSKGGAKWFPFGYHLKDLDASNLLHVIRQQIMGILGVTSNELGESEDINKSNGYNLSFVFKKRAVEPVLQEITESLTTFLLHDAMGFRQQELYFDEIDSRDDLLQAQIDDLLMKQGVVSINAIRNRRGDTNISGGDECYMWTGSAWIPVSMAPAFADAQLQALQLTNMQMMIAAQQALAAPADGEGATPGAGQAKVSPPILRAMRFPESYTTPDARGSSTPRLDLPKTKLAAPKNDTNPRRTRGAAETNRKQGLRKEETSGQ